MKVLFWADLFWPYIGGAEVFGASLLRALSRGTAEFVIVTSHYTQDLPDRDSFEGIPVYRFPFRALASGHDLRRFREVANGLAQLQAGFNPDLIHVNGIGPSAAWLVRANRGSFAPTLLTLQQEVLPSQIESGTLLHRLLTSAERIVGVSRGVVQQVRTMLPGLAAKLSCIYNGVEPPPIIPARLPNDPPRLLCLGRLVPAKRIEWALEAVHRLRDRFPRVQLDIAGDGLERSRLEARSRELGLGNRVRFMGWLDPARVWETINLSTAVLMPSLREGLPVSGVQAAIMGRPVVATAAGGLADVVRNGESGILAPIDDFEGFVAALALILEDPQLAAGMGQAARMRAASTFEWKATVKGYEQLYQTIQEALFESRNGLHTSA